MPAMKLLSACFGKQAKDAGADLSLQSFVVAGPKPLSSSHYQLQLQQPCTGPAPELSVEEGCPPIALPQGAVMTSRADRFSRESFSFHLQPSEDHQRAPVIAAPALIVAPSPVSATGLGRRPHRQELTRRDRGSARRYSASLLPTTSFDGLQNLSHLLRLTVQLYPNSLPSQATLLQQQQQQQRAGLPTLRQVMHLYSSADGVTAPSTPQTVTGTMALSSSLSSRTP